MTIICNRKLSNILLIGTIFSIASCAGLKDIRDNQVYDTVVIEDQTWMAKNLNYTMEESWCYDNLPENCDKYGRLYTWHAAMNACPENWHLPSKEEIETLLKMETKDKTIYEILIEGGTSEFDAVLGGLNGSEDLIYALESEGFYVSSTRMEDNFLGVWGVEFSARKEDAYISFATMGEGMSVRCIKD